MYINSIAQSLTAQVSKVEAAHQLHKTPNEIKIKLKISWSNSSHKYASDQTGFAIAQSLYTLRLKRSLVFIPVGVPWQSAAKHAHQSAISSSSPDERTTTQTHIHTQPSSHKTEARFGVHKTNYKYKNFAFIVYCMFIYMCCSLTTRKALKRCSFKHTKHPETTHSLHPQHLRQAVSFSPIFVFFAVSQDEAHNRPFNSHTNNHHISLHDGQKIKTGNIKRCALCDGLPASTAIPFLYTTTTNTATTQPANNAG